MNLKRSAPLALALTLALLLSACGKNGFDPQNVAQHYAAGSLRAEYTVTTHAGVFTEYKLSYRDGDGLANVTILQPDSVAGVSAVLQSGDAVIRYEDVSLDALLPEVRGYAPMDVLYCLLEDLRDGVPSSYALEKDVVLLAYQGELPDGTETLKQVALDPETLDLLSAELFLDGSLILALQAESFQWEGLAAG